MDIRLLESGDSGILAGVADGVFDEPVDPALAAEFLADPRHHIVVALDDGVVVGMATGVDYVHPDKPPELWVNEVGVADSHRERGIGRQLLEALLEHGRSLGCAEAWVLAEPDNVAAERLYHRAGGSASQPVVMMSFRLEKP